MKAICPVNRLGLGQKSFIRGEWEGVYESCMCFKTEETKDLETGSLVFA